MYNFNDSYAVILDDKFKPLLGAIGFYEPNTTTLKPIYSVDGLPLTNPVYCNGVPSKQIMLNDGYYTVRYWRYIGAGEMETDENPSNWFLYKTELIKESVNASQNVSSDVITLDTIAELKSFVPTADGQLVSVLGYYSSGDCPSREFIWDEDSELDDDGGVIIKSSNQNTGAWIMKIPGTYIDVRWYGDLPSADTDCDASNLGQRTKAANAANLYSKDLYFPSMGSELGYYGFNGSNTVAVTQNIICAAKVRFVVKGGTTGTLIACNQLVKDGKYLFVQKTGESIGGYQLQSDWINTSWLKSMTNVSGARRGYIVDEVLNPLTFVDTKVIVNVTPTDCTFNNCEVISNKKISTSCIMYNLTLKTDWFSDDYNWNLLSISGCNIKLDNCKDANTYILLKNKQNDGNYGDLGEQTISATILPGIIENCTGSITISTPGDFEFHNVNLTVTGITSACRFNAIDSWFVINSPVVIGKLDLRRGSISGTGNLQVLTESLLDSVDLSIALNSRGVKLNLIGCKIQANVIGTEIKFHNCELTATIEQIQNNVGVITVDCCNNKFKANGFHYIHATVPDSIVEGQWMNNSCEYDTTHWIKLNRLNLKKADWEHKYDYIGNQEPYLEKYNGYNWNMKFALYKGHLGSTERGIFSTYGIPFIWYNTGTNELSVVNRYSCYWKMFTVGLTSTRRIGRLLNSQPLIGIMDGDYTNHNVRKAPVVWTWDSGIALANQNWVMNAVCTDNETNDASYNWTFELPYQNHTLSNTSNGVIIGCLASNPGESWSSPSVYPSEPSNYWYLHIILEPDIRTRSGLGAGTCGAGI